MGDFFQVRKITTMKRLMSYLGCLCLGFSAGVSAYSPADQVALAEDIYYLQLGAGHFNAGSSSTLAPLMGFGKRFEIDEAAMDISATWAMHESHRGNETTFYALPKITYLQFAQPAQTSTFFYGGGLSWSSVKKDQASKFRGLFGQVVVGYEFKRQVRYRPFIQLEFMQPLVAQKKVGQFPGPSALITLNLGF